jgi:RimJ/RimL family protein N-acetyltransferase
MRLIRRLAPGETPALLAHFLDLSQVDRRLRFCVSASDAMLRRHCAEIDWARSLFLGCFSGGNLIGEAHLLWAKSGAPDSAEIAISVARGHRGAGVGTDLILRAMSTARARHLRTMRFASPAENEPMQRLALKIGGRLVTDGDLAEGTIDVSDWKAGREARQISSRHPIVA